jgi:Flp pilus assembly protein TadG
LADNPLTLPVPLKTVAISFDVLHEVLTVSKPMRIIRRSGGFRGRGRRRAVSVVWMIIAMTALCALASLGVDYGRAQVVKSELRRAADAAARAAASTVGDVTKAQDTAVQYAGYNKADGKSVVIVKDSDDIQFVKWDTATRTYTVLAGTARNGANAVRIRTKADVPLVWGSMLGGNGTTHIEAVAICAVSPENYGIIGLNSINMSGRTTSSYWSSTGDVVNSSGNIASNGNISLNGGATIQGNARTYKGSVSGGTVTGTTAPLPTALSFPNGDATPYFTNNNNTFAQAYMNGAHFSLGKNQVAALPGGNYVFNNFSAGTGSVLTFNGPTTIYCYGTFNMTGQTVTKDSLPTNLKVVMCPGPTGQAPGSLTVTAGAALYANIYAPQSAVTIGGGGEIYGSVLGLTVNLNGSGGIHYDLSLQGAGGIVMVR